MFPEKSKEIKLRSRGWHITLFPSPRVSGIRAVGVGYCNIDTFSSTHRPVPQSRFPARAVQCLVLLYGQRGMGDGEGRGVSGLGMGVLVSPAGRGGLFSKDTIVL